MRNKRLVGFLTLFTSLFCIYYLSFTFISNRIQNKATIYATDENGNVCFAKKQQFLDDAWKKPVYKFFALSYTYEEVKEKELALGLDLQGGMHVTLEISPIDLIKSLAGNSKDEIFLEALSGASIKQKEQPNESFTKLFYKEYKALAPNSSLNSLFAIAANSTRIAYNATDKEILKTIDNEIESAIERSFDIIRARIDKFGTSQPNMQHLKGTNRIQIELPGVSNPERVRKMLQGVAQLKFWEVYALEDLVESLESIDQFLVAEQKTLDEVTSSSEQGKSENSPLFHLLKRSGGGLSYETKDVNTIQAILDRKDVKALLPRNLKWCWDAKSRINKNTGEELLTLYAIKQGNNGEAALEGDMVSDAQQVFDPNGQPVVNMQMNATGSRIWKKVTAASIGKQIAVALDDYIYSAPVVNTEIPNGSSQITGNFTIEEAQDLASILKAGSLPVPVKIVEEAIVGPTLGQESQQQGIMSMFIGLLVVIAFMMLYYAKGGVIANSGLLFNMLFIIGILAQLGAALTLPGIAGIVLTIGMSIDANVLIFERIREEIAAGSKIKQAVNVGYSKAFSSILDSNITTFLTGVILYLLGQGPIRGFATTLMLGIVCSFFSSVYITRYIITSILERKSNPNISFSFKWTTNLFTGINIDFIKNRFKAYIFSLAVIIIGFVCILKQEGLNLGVDFTGGRAFVVAFGKAIDPSQVRDTLIESFEGQSTEVKTYGSSDVLKITTSYLINDEDEEAEYRVKSTLIDAIQNSCNLQVVEVESDKISENSFAIISSSKVGSSMAKDIQSSAMRSILFSLLMIFIYIVLRFRKWQFGLAAVIALLHDMLVVFSAFGIARAFGVAFEIDQVFVASVLTIIGYSINDTVVIFDRVRELFKKPSLTLNQTVNASINETLSRTIITSFTTIIAVLVLFLFGGQVLRGFSYAMLVGVVFGTYSSIFIAMPLVADLSRGKAKDAKK
jgi:SecD/SecF fusion protein